MEIEVKFLFEGKEYSGTLSKVSGASNSKGLYHLTIDRKYKGQLSWSQHENNWVFSTQKGWFPDIAEQLLKYL